MITVADSINRLNLLRWHPVSGAVLPFTQAIKSKDTYHLPVLPGDTVSFFVNTDSPLLVVPSDLTVGIIYCGQIVKNLGVINAVPYAAGYYRLYGTYTIPELNYGAYNYAIYKANTLEVLYISNPIKVVPDDRLTAVLKYRNRHNIIGFDYDALPGFYNRIRIGLNLFDEQTMEETSEYKDLDYNIITPKIVIRKEIQLETDYVTNADHDALHFALRHSEFYIDDIRYKAISGYERETERMGYGSSAAIRLQDINFTENLTFCN